MTKDELKQLAALQREINLLQNHIEQMPVEYDWVVGSDDEFPYGRQTIGLGGYSNERYKRIRTGLERKKQECLAKVDEMTTFINTVEDSLLRQLLIMRYIQRKKWQQIVAEMGYEYTEDQLRKKLERFLEKK